MPVADEENFYVGSWSGFYFAFDQKTGKMRWRTQTGWPETGGGLPDSAAPTLHKDHLYVQKRGFILAAINIHSGAPRAPAKRDVGRSGQLGLRIIRSAGDLHTLCVLHLPIR